ncbi:hypothetical protein [Rouxiella sp. Mn2063]|uniref:hypothetical protein n=1 Tax=Rouxiella sp. Mn2063 TaxID=3395262 RepID=UPI003BBACF8F
MKILVTSASGANGDGYGQVLAFSIDGLPLGTFSDDPRITDPRGMRVSTDSQLLYINSGSDRILALDKSGTIQLDSGHIPGLNAGGGNLGPNGQYYVGLRTDKTVTAFPANLDSRAIPVLQHGVVPFPRGFAYADDGSLFLASGIGPQGNGENTILEFSPDGKLKSARHITDNAVSPLDLAIGPNGNILVSSEFPYGQDSSVTTVREYDRLNGELVRIFSPEKRVSFRHPRGLRFGPGGHLYCVAQDEVVVFDFYTGQFLDVVIHHPRLNGQAIEFFGD